MFFQKKHFPYVINQPEKCKDEKGRPYPRVFLILAIKSKASDFSRRMSVRKTWGNESLIAGVIIKRYRKHILKLTRIELKIKFLINGLPTLISDYLVVAKRRCKCRSLLITLINSIFLIRRGFSDQSSNCS